MNTDGTAAAQLTAFGDVSLPRLSNGVVVFRRSDPLYTTRLWRMDSTGANAQPVPNGEGVLEYDLDPSGSRLVLTYWNNFVLYTMNLDGSNRIAINTTQNMHQVCMSWGRDGYIYFDQSYYGNAYSQMLFRIPEAGMNNPQLVVPYFSQFPGASGPSGKVAYLYNQPAPMLAIMNGDGTDLAPVPNSPSGIWGNIAFDYDLETVYFIQDSAVWRMNTDGTGLLRLADGVQIFAFYGGYNGVDFGYVPPPPGGPGVASVWVGLKNSDDQGTQFDLRSEVYRDGVLLSAGETLCITGVTRNANLAKAVSTSISEFSGGFGSGDVLSLKILTRIGTNPDGSKCTGPGGSHSNAVGLRLYFSSASRPSALSTALGNTPVADYFLRLNGTALVLDPAAPSSSTALYRDSPSVNYQGGNAWKEIGEWRMTVQ